MNIPIYPEGHLKLAKELYIEKSIDLLWFKMEWTDTKINLWKYQVNKSFIKGHTFEYSVKNMFDETA